MKLHILMIDKEIILAHRYISYFKREVKEILRDDLLGTIESLLGHQQNPEELIYTLIDLERDMLDVIELAKNFEYEYIIKD